MNEWMNSLTPFDSSVNVISSLCVIILRKTTEMVQHERSWKSCNCHYFFNSNKPAVVSLFNSDNILLYELHINCKVKRSEKRREINKMKQLFWNWVWNKLNAFGEVGFNKSSYHHSFFSFRSQKSIKCFCFNEMRTHLERSSNPNFPMFSKKKNEATNGFE